MNRVNVTVIRHPKEKKSKCSLQPLVGRPDIEFLTAGPKLQFDASGYILLAVGEKELSIEDKGHPLLLLDSTWRLLPDLEKCVLGTPIRRSLPKGIQTAYPRVSKIAEDPAGGLASVEALFLAKALLGDYDESLLDDYYWKNTFLKKLGSIGLGEENEK